MSNKLDILITADNSKAHRAFKDTQGDINALDRTIGRMNKSLSQARGNLGKGLKVAGVGAAVGVGALAVAGAGATRVISSLISAGSDVEEMMGKYSTVFADGAGTTEELTDNLDAFAKLVGRNKYDLRGYAAAFGDTFKPLGFATDDAADLSEVMTQLTVDLASFNNMAEGEVAQRLQSTLIGNHGNVLKFGVIINEATLQQELMRMGMADLTGAALEQAKVQARLNLIIAGTTDAQGDALRTSGSWANQMRRLQSVFSEAKADMGVKLLPVFTPILEEVTALAGEHLPALTDAFANWIGTIDVDAMSGKMSGFFEGLTEQVNSLAAGEGLKINIASMLGVDTTGLEIPITFKRAGFVFESPLADLGLNQDGGLTIDLDFSMQSDEKIAWGDVFSFERNVALGTSDIKINWGDVFSFARVSEVGFFNTTTISWGDVFKFSRHETVGFLPEFKLTVGDFIDAKFDITDIIDFTDADGFVQDMLTLDTSGLSIAWDSVIESPAWTEFVGELSWGDFIPDVTWGAFIPGVTWGAFISGLSWGDFVGGLDWSRFISPFGGGGGGDGSVQSRRDVPDGGGGFFGFGEEKGFSDGPPQRDDRVTTGLATGTNFWRGGPTWVGERGPEIVNLPRGAQVIPAAQSASMTQPTITINASISNGVDVEMVAIRVAEMIRARGAFA